MMKRRQFIVQRAFQFKYGLLLSIMGFLVSFILSSVLYYFVYQNYKLLESFQLLSTPTIIETLEKEIRTITFFLIFCVIFLTLFLFIAGLVISHRLAGPIFKLKLLLKEMSKGKYHQRLILRNSDEYQDLPAYFNEMAETLELKEQYYWLSLKELLHRFPTLNKDLESELNWSIENRQFRLDLETFKALHKKKES